MLRGRDVMTNNELNQFMAFWRKNRTILLLACCFARARTILWRNTPSRTWASPSASAPTRSPAACRKSWNANCHLWRIFKSGLRVWKSNAMNQNISHRNHYIPQFYLKNWSSDGRTIQTYSILVSNENVPYWTKQSIKNTAVWNDFYTRVVGVEELDDFEHWFDREFESPAKPILVWSRKAWYGRMAYWKYQSRGEFVK